MLGHTIKDYMPVQAVSIEYLVTEDNFYRQVERSINLDFVRDLARSSTVCFFSQYSLFEIEYLPSPVFFNRLCACAAEDSRIAMSNNGMNTSAIAELRAVFHYL